MVDTKKNPAAGTNDSQRHDSRRRKAMNVATKAGIGLTVANWFKPIVQSVVLPAHAQTSAYYSVSRDEGEFQVRLTVRPRSDYDSTA